MSQLRLLAALEPEQVVAEAENEYGPFLTRFCLVSGGKDSSVTAHRSRDLYDELAFIDTGTALPGVREHVEEFAAWIGKPLRIYTTPRSEYDRLVLGSDTPRSTGTPDVGAGFPGPAIHGSCYTRLKERQLESLQRDLKVDAPRSARVLYLTGLRRAESQRRRSRPALSKKAGRVFANPLIDWTDEQVLVYHREAKIPVSDVSALLHRSGECNCGAFAMPGERALLQALFPEWFADRIAPLEQAAEAAGFGDLAVWGHGINADQRRRSGAVGELCHDCQLRFET